MGEWIEWNGGENPVQLQRLEVVFRDGTTDSYMVDFAFALDWKHRSTGKDVMKYRVVELAKE